MTAIEIKGSTSTDNLAPRRSTPLIYRRAMALKAQVRQIRPPHSCGKSPAPGFITVPQGDTVTLTAFVVNGDHHDVAVLAPDEQVVVPTALWQRGREYQVSFVAEKAGTYHLKCFAHAPTMTANILVLPRWHAVASMGHARSPPLRLWTS